MIYIYLLHHWYKQIKPKSMKLKKWIFVALLTALIIPSTFAQRKKNKESKEKKEDKEVETLQIIELGNGVEIDLEMDSSEAVEMDRPFIITAVPPISESSTTEKKHEFDSINNIRYKTEYTTTSINDKYDWFSKVSDNHENRWGISAKDGSVILPNIFNRSYQVKNNLFILSIERNYGVYDLSEQRWTIPIGYDYIENSSSNYFIARKNGMTGLIDNNNTVLIPFEWSSIYTLNNLDNYFIVGNNSTTDKRSGIYNIIEKKLIVPCIYNQINTFDEQNNFRVTIGSKHNIIDINNNTRFKNWYDELTMPSRDRSYYIVKMNNLYGVIDDNENQIVPIEYLEIANYPHSDGSYLARDKHGKYGFMTIDGRITLPFEYDNLNKRYNNNVVSMQNGKCGLVQINSGTPYVIATCDFDEVTGSNKVFIVEKAGKFGLLDKYGKTIAETVYLSIEPLTPLNSGSVLFKANKDNMYILLDEMGKPVSSDRYSDIEIVSNSDKSSSYGISFSYLKVRDKNGKYQILDKAGKTVSRPIFDDIVSENQNNFIVKNNGKFGIYYLLDKSLVVDYKYDIIINSKSQYLAFEGKNIESLLIKSGQLSGKKQLK